jgi:hypothetical protein
MRLGIKVKVLTEPDDDGLFQFEIGLSNGQSSTSLAFWGYGDNFKEFGERLIEFPQGIHDKVIYELGGEKGSGERKWAYYLSLSAFCFEPTGKSAIKVIVDNHSNAPDYQRCEFYIKSEPASLNKLGQGLSNWNPVNVKEFEWISNG